MSLTPSEKSMKAAEDLELHESNCDYTRRCTHDEEYCRCLDDAKCDCKAAKRIALALDQREQSVWEEATKIIEEAYRSYNPSKSPSVFVDSLLSARSKSLKE